MWKRLKPYIGPKRFIFKDPDTGYIYKAPSRQALIQHIVSYRAQNQLEPLERLDLILEHYWCNLPENFGSCEKSPEKLKRGLLGYLKGGIMVMKNVFYGEDNMVSQEKADARASICVRCPLNVFPDKGPFVKWSDDIAEASTGGKKSKFHNDLGNCAACSCPLKAKVFYKGPMNLKPEEVMQMPRFCWAKQQHLRETGETDKI